MASRHASVLHGETLIGTVVLKDWDRSMGVAGGVFVPNARYIAHLHATELEGVDRSGHSGRLRVRMDDGAFLSPEAVALVDWAATAGDEHGRELSVFGLDLDALFGPEEPLA